MPKVSGDFTTMKTKMIKVTKAHKRKLITARLRYFKIIEKDVDSQWDSDLERRNKAKFWSLNSKLVDIANKKAEIGHWANHLYMHRRDRIIWKGKQISVAKYLELNKNNGEKNKK